MSLHVHYFIVSASLQIPKQVFCLLTLAATRVTLQKHFQLAEYITQFMYAYLITRISAEIFTKPSPLFSISF